jgi:hypothetical protein
MFKKKILFYYTSISIIINTREDNNGQMHSIVENNIGGTNEIKRDINVMVNQGLNGNNLINQGAYRNNFVSPIFSSHNHRFLHKIFLGSGILLLPVYLMNLFISSLDKLDLGCPFIILFFFNLFASWMTPNLTRVRNRRNNMDVFNKKRIICLLINIFSLLMVILMNILGFIGQDLNCIYFSGSSFCLSIFAYIETGLEGLMLITSIVKICIKN